MPELSPRVPDGLPGLPGGSVTLGLLDGRTKTGHVTGFALDEADIALDTGTGDVELVPAAAVAYVAFHRTPNEAALGPESGAEPYRIHTIGGPTFSVLARPARGRVTGFRAVPREAKSPFSEFYFYSHGVRAREKDQPLGVMLVRSGAIHPDALEHAVVAQRNEREVPIGKILVQTLQIAEADVAKTIALQKTTNQRIGELLIKQGLATPKQIEGALAEQRRRRSRRLGETLLDLNIVSEETLSRTLAKKFDLRFVDLDLEPPDPAAVAAVPREIIERHGILPVERSETTLVVAISDPLTSAGLDEVRAAVMLRVEEVIAAPSAIKRCLDQLLERTPSIVVEADNSEFEVILQGLADAPAQLEQPQELRPPAPITIEPSSLDPIEALLRQIARDAAGRRASHVHIEPAGSATHVRFRIDGRCVIAQHVAAHHQRALIARLKIMAGLDASRHESPQTGKARLHIGDRDLDLSVATLPTFDGGEDVVLRLLSAPRLFRLSELDLSEQNQEILRTLIESPYGLLLCTGPSGSGKTTTLHAALDALDSADTAIMSAEDPIEIVQAKIRQVRVGGRGGLGFAEAVRALLEADADVILIGKLADTETARAALEASLAGRRVFAASPVRHAAQAVTRLLDQGLDPLGVADALLGVLAQRLVRRLCVQCKQKRSAKPQELELIAPATEVWHAPGCAACNGSGYDGMIAVHELLIADDSVKGAIARRAPAEEIERLARARKIPSLAEDGMLKARSGHTDLRQVVALG